MTHKTNSTTTRLLHFLGQRSIRFSRLFARILAGFVNIVHSTKTSKTIRLNIEICLPQYNRQQREYITQAAIRNELQSYFEFFAIWGSSSTKNISRIRKIRGESYFHDALAQGKGLVLIVPHFGTWEIMNAWVAQHTQMTIMYKPIKNEDADAFVKAARSREQAHLVPTDESGVRQIFKALKQGGTTVILPDHSPHQGGELIKYFGIPLSSSNLSAKLIQKTKSKALFLYAIRNDNQGFDMVVQPIDEKIYQVDANQGTHMIYTALEKLICQYPEHYHWSYKRFKAHPKLKQIYNVSNKEAMEMVNSVRNDAITESEPL